MHILYDQPAELYSTFRLKTRLATLIEVSCLADLAQLDITVAPLVLGEGSNTIFLQAQTRPIVRFTGNRITESWLDDKHCLLHVEAGHNWHQLVTTAVQQQLWGIENLALIPGSVGAAPVQNIGAYGVELADVCAYVDYYHWQTRSLQRLTASNCNFGYRDSVFKHQLASEGIIVAVGIRLSTVAKPVLSYQGLDKLPAGSSIKEIYQQVIVTRNSKLPDYRLLANCGSFFKNPVIDKLEYQRLQQHHPTIPGFKQDTNQVKVPAAWLIDQQGFKGFRFNDIGCYSQQPLVLVNYGDGNAEDLLTLISEIQSKVYQAYQITLEPEVRLLNSDGQHYV
ncbi:UDP-N-acetylenolpyruvoylglucosamine reductase [Arsukibacterium ikkense]|uniref:UDP-N-acetylenolpyruvoylglucosamine reductase n=1 Tax=Arsukibacterium ikkense TaxID=336831 RepID=A0A0M2UZ21_9GAMM|nr:UDP-N-acetylmuramate dehydrogenase [Arsukibacterium ikkense]KKO43807.1 UDP-N-acetylenolpyruvoylglucosamine reductase [Arsukibacterium ikkense]